MPLFNEVGEPLPRLKLSVEEIARLAWLASLRLDVPEERAMIFHLKVSDFRKWFYQLNPRESLLLASNNDTSDEIRRQMYPTRRKQIVDFLWRLVH